MNVPRADKRDGRGALRFSPSLGARDGTGRSRPVDLAY